jgi:hypothetical protein
MKLSVLVDYYNYLCKLKPETAQDEIFKILDPIIYFIQNHDLKLHSVNDQLTQNKLQINQSVDQFLCTMTALKDQVKTMIEAQYPEYFENSENLYTNEMSRDSHETILSRRIRMHHDTNLVIRSRIMKYGDWRSPAMIVRPGQENLVEHIVGCTPLYVVDHHQELMRPLIESFNPHFQNRLCTYVITEAASGMLKELPQDQIGFCLAYNFFNYKSFNATSLWLQQLWHVLRPGGVIGLTFNNCDYAAAVTMAERCYMTFIP